MADGLPYSVRWTDCNLAHWVENLDLVYYLQHSRLPVW